jgi:molecular chaperone DnaK (HSP70)
MRSPYVESRIGDSAKNAFHSNPTNTVFDAKRLIGRKMEEPELQRDMKHWWETFFSSKNSLSL